MIFQALSSPALKKKRAPIYFNRLDFPYNLIVNEESLIYLLKSFMSLVGILLHDKEGNIS